MIGILKRLGDDVQSNSRPRLQSEEQRIPPLFVQSNFFEHAGVLRQQLERVVTQSLEISDGLTPFVYAFSPDAYQFLTATAERIFSRELLDQFLATLRTWAMASVGASFVTTPQIRVYINGCGRALLRDSTDAQWHWMLSLSPQNRKNGEIRILPETSSLGRPDSLSFDRLLNTNMQFNELLVHPTTSAYAVGTTKGSMHPLEGSVLLDGYLW